MFFQQPGTCSFVCWLPHTQHLVGPRPPPSRARRPALAGDDTRPSQRASARRQGHRSSWCACAEPGQSDVICPKTKVLTRLLQICQQDYCMEGSICAMAVYMNDIYIYVYVNVNVYIIYIQIYNICVCACVCICIWCSHSFTPTTRAGACNISQPRGLSVRDTRLQLCSLRGCPHCDPLYIYIYIDDIYIINTRYTW